MLRRFHCFTVGESGRKSQTSQSGEASPHSKRARPPPSRRQTPADAPDCRHSVEAKRQELKPAGVGLPFRLFLPLENDEAEAIPAPAFTPLSGR
jgi:hypothetical protein